MGVQGLSGRLSRPFAALVVVVAAWAVTTVPAGATRTPVTGWSPTTSPGAYDYGTLPEGQTAVRTFTLSNTGGSATSALRITLTGSAAFSKTGDGCTATSIGPDKTCQVTVAFEPATPGESDRATLTATANKAAATAGLTLEGGLAKAAPVLVTSPGPGGTVGATTVTDTATLSGGFDPTGAITFNLYPTADCSGPAVDSETVAVTADGSYATPTGFAPTTAGTYQWTAAYTGDAHNSPTATGCGTEQASITPAGPTLATSSAALVLAGSPVQDTAILAGGFQPTGTITFNLYATADCSGAPGLTQTVTVAGNGTYGTAASNPPPGSYQWTAAYSGDADNTATTTGCGSEPVTVSRCLVVDTTSNQSFAALQDAVNAAGSGDSLTVAGTCAGDTTIAKGLTLTGQAPTGPLSPPPFLNGNQSGTTLTITPGAVVTVNRLDISGGTANGCCGGGISNSGTLTLNDVVVLDNSTLNGAGGGGIGNFGSLTLNSSEVAFNTPSNGGGGGIWSNGTVILNGDSTVTGNSSATQGGGGIFNALGGTVILNDTSSISGNSNGNGGGIYNDGTVTLNGSSSISGNTSAVDGGGVWSDGTLTLNGSSTITGNTAGGHGGGILNAGTLTGATAGTGGNVFSNTPDDIFPPAAPTLTTSSAAVALLGSSLTDTAILTGGSNPTGTINFVLYPTVDCSGSPVDVEPVQVSGDGTYATPTGYTAVNAGTYQWVAIYSGDATNGTTSTGCGSEAVTVGNCLVEDTAGDQAFAVLPDAVNAAAAGDTLTVEGMCIGATTVGKNLTLTGQATSGFPTPTIDGNGLGTAITVQEASLTINTLTVTGGFDRSGLGGGIYVVAGALTLNNAIVSGNTGGDGGGIDSNGSTVTLNNSTVTGNTATVDGGGLLNNGGGMTLNSSTVSDNTCTGGGGGIWSTGTLTLNGATTVSGNTQANEGGGIDAESGTVTLDDSTSITANTAGIGGGVAVFGATLTMTGSATITDNTSTVSQGGGVFNNGTLVGVVPGVGGNVFGNQPDDVHPLVFG